MNSCPCVRFGLITLLAATSASVEPSFSKFKLDSFFYAEGAAIAD